MAWRIRDVDLPPPARPVRLVMPSRGPLGAALQAALRTAAGRMATMPPPGTPALNRHPLTPAAIRVERSRSRQSGGHADQTAVTMWFGAGPALPGAPIGNPALRATMRLGAGMIGAAALAAATTMAARRGEQRLAAAREAGPQEALVPTEVTGDALMAAEAAPHAARAGRPPHADRDMELALMPPGVDL
ncbi:MAG: hypothetical protein ABR564_08155 [Candidatus Dormibacteria bacterium]